MESSQVIWSEAENGALHCPKCEGPPASRDGQEWPSEARRTCRAASGCSKKFTPESFLEIRMSILREMTTFGIRLIPAPTRASARTELMAGMPRRGSSLSR